jgi:hypothetical protein
VALQALDAHSTLTALELGAREANPVMQPVSSATSPPCWP